MGREKPGKPRRPRKHEPADQLSGTWTNSDVDPVTGEYFLSMSLEGDRIWSLTPDEGWTYAKAVATQIARATHDAAVFNQLVETGVQRLYAGQVIVNDLQPDRRPVEWVGPFRIEPALTIAGKPFLTLHEEGKSKPIGQWEIADARSHLLGLIETIETVELDSKLRQVLVHTIDLDDDKARVFVHLLKDYRDGK